MDLPSYIMGKKSSGGGGGGADISEYFTSSIESGTSYAGGFAFMVKKIPETTEVATTNLSNAFNNFRGVSIPLIDTSNVTNMSSMFIQCINITSIPLLNTSKAKNMSGMFSNCSNLTTVPILDTKSATNMQSMFSGCTSLSDDSLDNILQMCIGATSYYLTKTLSQLGFTSTYYPASKIQGLPHYQDFIDAGWTIGY